MTFFLASVIYSQKTPDVYSIYMEQFSYLLNSRGISQFDIKKILQDYSGNKISSDTDFALLLDRLYSRKKNIGILFYFYNNDTLRRAYYKPG